MFKTVKALGPQFVRIEHYAIGPSNHSKSRKGGNDVSFIVREFLRVPTASLHVSHPQPPVLLLGNVDHVRTLPARLREGAKSVRSASGRRQRIDCPVLMPIILGFVIMTKAVNDPNSSLAVFGSLFPLTSPIVMMGRITYDIPFWQLATSILLLIGCFLLFTWMTGKIYRTGILMYGKKPSWKEMIKWGFKRS